MGFDVASVRARYPALRDGYAWLDGAAGTQVPEPVIDAIASTYRAGIGNVGGAFPASQRSTAIVEAARHAVADLVGADPRGVVFGPNMTTLTYRFAATLARTWRTGDEIVLSRLDHDANVRPWLQAAERAGAVVRWAEVELPSGELPTEQYASLVGERTRLVAVTAASNLAGVVAAVEHLAGLDPAATGSRRARVLASMAAVEAHEQAELAYLVAGLRAMAHVQTIGSPARRTATVYFSVAGHPAREVAQFLASRRINVWSGHCYAWELTGALGIRDTGGAVRAGLVHYNDRSDVDRLLAAVAELAPS